MRIDPLSLFGVLAALITLVGGSILKGSGINALLSPAAFVIVFIGTLAAISLHTPLPVIRRALQLVRWVFQPPREDLTAIINNIVNWSHSARKQGLLSLEGAIEAEADPFVRRGLQMLVDGAEPAAIRSAMELEMDLREQRDLAAAKVFESMGVYSPTLGIIGAVMGLMAVLKNLADPSKLGNGIAAAFVATIYGIGLANLFFLPLAAKLKAIISGNSQTREMIIEGLIGISQGENPRNIEARLRSFLD